MKIKNKILFIVVIFFIAIILNNISFADVDFNNYDFTSSYNYQAVINYAEETSKTINLPYYFISTYKYSSTEFLYKVIFFDDLTYMTFFKYDSSTFFLMPISDVSQNAHIYISSISTYFYRGSVYFTPSLVELNKNNSVNSYSTCYYSFIATYGTGLNFNSNSISSFNGIYCKCNFYKGVYCDSSFAFNDLSFIDGYIQSIEPPVVYNTVNLYIDDQNLRKRFNFQLKIPMIKEDTKYYIFLDDYTRHSYNSVTADFLVYTVTTPEDYDYTNYENYMYYDNIEKGKLYFPAGCTVQQFYVQSQNGELYQLEKEYEFVAERNMEGSFSYNDHIFTKIDFYQILWQNLGFNYNGKKNIIFTTSSSFNNTNFDNIFLDTVLGCISAYFAPATGGTSLIAKAVLTSSLFSLFNYNTANIDATNEVLYYNILHCLYYGQSVNQTFADTSEKSTNFYNFGDFVASNHSIVSYENEKYYNTEKSGGFYDIYRKTKVYNKQNRLRSENNSFVINYSDGQNVSSMLPAEVDQKYLTSILFKDNENTSSGGYITYDIKEVIQGDKIIDYSKEDNSIHNTFNKDYIENFYEGDNIVINNYYTEVVDKTSNDYLLHNIYTAILDIKASTQNIDNSISNTTNNFSFNFKNEVNYLFNPNTYTLKADLDNLSNTAKEHLGLVYQPTEFIVYALGLFAILNSDSEILLDIPEIKLSDTTLIPQTRFSFTDYMQNDLPILYTIHQLYLSAVDFIILGLLIYFAYKVYREVFKNDNR